MRRLLFSCALMVAVSLSFMAPPSASAGSVMLTLGQPQPTASGATLLTGKVAGTKQVSVEALQGNRWKSVAKAAVDWFGTYRATVPTPATPTWYRARALTTYSAPVLVQAASRPVAEQPSDFCGPRPQKADGSLWACTLADDFTGTELNRKVWMPQTNFASGDTAAWACYLDDPSVVSVRDGALHLGVRKLSKTQPCPGHGNLPTRYVAGMVTTYQLFSQQYGRFEARFKNTATTAPGLHEAFWLWPDDRYSTGTWPAAGEIDVVETYSQYPDLAIPFLHYTASDNGGPVPGSNTAWDCVAKRGEFNTYTLEWTADRLEILVNGKSCLVNASGDPAFHKPYIVALTQALGVATNAYDGEAPLPASMTVDYVKVWK